MATLGGLAKHLAAVERACAASRQAAAGFSLDHCVPHPRMGQVSLFSRARD